MKRTILSVVVLLQMIILSAQTADETTKALQAFETKLKATPAAQILDLRSAEEFAQNHLNGAVNIEVQDEDVERQLESLQKNKPVFVYSIRTGRSSVMVKRLQERGFAEVYELPGGIAAWIGSGRPVEGPRKEALTLAAFQQQVKGDAVVLVEVGTRYCGACKKQALIVDSIQKEKGIATRFVDIYDHQSLAKDLKITAIPTLLLYKDGKLSWQHDGLLPKEQVAAQLVKEKQALVKTK
jgi:rhodanese-related sulfurtransferase